MARFPLKNRKKNGRHLPRERAGGLSDGAWDAVHGATIRAAGPSRRLWSLLGTPLEWRAPSPSSGEGILKVPESAILDAATECRWCIVLRTIRQLPRTALHMTGEGCRGKAFYFFAYLPVSCGVCAPSAPFSLCWSRVVRAQVRLSSSFSLNCS